MFLEYARVEVPDASRPGAVVADGGNGCQLEETENTCSPSVTVRFSALAPVPASMNNEATKSKLDCALFILITVVSSKEMFNANMNAIINIGKTGIFLRCRTNREPPDYPNLFCNVN